MPRKIAGIATITIDASIVAIVMLSVVLERATHRYLSGRPPLWPGGAPLGVRDVPFTGSESTTFRTLPQSTPNHLLDGNYLSPDSVPPKGARRQPRRRRRLTPRARAGPPRSRLSRPRAGVLVFIQNEQG